jgi:hypothetical protein
MAAIDPWSDVRAAIRQRDIRALARLMFRGGEPILSWGFHTENELWDYKKDCPKSGKETSQHGLTLPQKYSACTITEVAS